MRELLAPPWGTAHIIIFFVLLCAIGWSYTWSIRLSWSDFCGDGQEVVNAVTGQIGFALSVNYDRCEVRLSSGDIKVWRFSEIQRNGPYGVTP